MIRVALLTAVLLAACNDLPLSRATRSNSTVTDSASASTPAKAPDPEIR